MYTLRGGIPKRGVGLVRFPLGEFFLRNRRARKRRVEPLLALHPGRVAVERVVADYVHALPGRDAVHDRLYVASVELVERVLPA
jgi:hypothetical protein